MKTKIMFIVLVVVLIISVVFNINYMVNKEREKNVFFNSAFHYVKVIDSGLKNLQKYYTTSDYNNFKNEMNMIIKNTYLLDELLNAGSNFVDTKIGYSGVDYGFKYIGYAFEGCLNDNKYQGAFTEDGIISDSEIKFINQLSSDLGIILSAIENEEEHSINSNMTFKDFNNALEVFIKKWDIYGERSTLGFSPYDYLLIKK